MSIERCERTELLVDQCAHCRPPTDTPGPDARIVHTFQARYAGRCDWCDGPIQVGNRIGRDEADNYVCEGCLP